MLRTGTVADTFDGFSMVTVIIAIAATIAVAHVTADGC